MHKIVVVMFLASALRQVVAGGPPPQTKKTPKPTTPTTPTVSQTTQLTTQPTSPPTPPQTTPPTTPPTPPTTPPTPPKTPPTPPVGPTAATDKPSNAFQCYPNRTIHFTNPNEVIYTHFKAFYDYGGYKTICDSSADSTRANIYFDCFSTTSTVTAYFSDRSLSTDYILGGKDVSVLCYTFVCGNLTDYNQTISKDLGVLLNHTDEYSTPTYNITAGFFIRPGEEITSAQVGDTVYFVITGPAEYDLLPLECHASGAAGEYETVILNGCTEDHSLMDSFMVQNGAIFTDYNATLYVFKFYDSDIVTITCNVQVCVTGSCPFYCRGYGRKRRQVTVSNLNEEVDLKMASVGKSLKIVNVLLGGSIQTHGSTTLTLLMSMLVGFMQMYCKNG